MAWNSFAHTEFFQQGPTVAQLPPTEPIKVGVAIVYGGLSITKTVDDPSGESDALEFDIDYECTVTPEGGSPVVVASGTVTLAGGATADVPTVPAGASCAVWEPDAQGLISNAPDRASALMVDIPIDAASTIATAAIVNTAQPAPTTTTTTTTTEPGTTTTEPGATTTTTSVPGATTTTTAGAGGAGGAGGTGGTGGTGGGLPATGTDTARLLAIAMVLVGLGLLATSAVRRRPTGD